MDPRGRPGSVPPRGRAGEAGDSGEAIIGEPGKSAAVVGVLSETIAKMSLERGAAGLNCPRMLLLLPLRRDSLAFGDAGLDGRLRAPVLWERTTSPASDCRKPFAA